MSVDQCPCAKCQRNIPRPPPPPGLDDVGVLVVVDEDVVQTVEMVGRWWVFGTVDQSGGDPLIRRFEVVGTDGTSGDVKFSPQSHIDAARRQLPIYEEREAALREYRDE